MKTFRLKNIFNIFDYLKKKIQCVPFEKKSQNSITLTLNQGTSLSLYTLKITLPVTTSVVIVVFFRLQNRSTLAWIYRLKRINKEIEGWTTTKRDIMYWFRLVKTPMSLRLRKITWTWSYVGMKKTFTAETSNNL